jgi:hypothetical protein
MGPNYAHLHKPLDAKGVVDPTINAEARSDSLDG